MKFTLLPQQAITVNTYEEAARIAEMLLKNRYVVMLSREENLWCINWTYSEFSDRNDVVFIDRETFEEEIYNLYKKREE